MSASIDGERIAIVTGVSRGLGEALGDALLARGVGVTGIGRSSSDALAKNDRYRFVECDLSDPASIAPRIAPVFEEIANREPAWVMLVNNAATAAPTGIVGALDRAALERSLALNLTAPMLLADLFRATFTRDETERTIVNVSSGAAQMPLAGAGAYCVAKSGLEMLTRVVAAESRSPTFRAISVRPGIIDTEMQHFMRSQPSARLPSVGLFQGFHHARQLVSADAAARKIVDRLLLSAIESGRTYSYPEL